MTDWTAFAGFSGVVVLLLLLLARASQSMLSRVATDGTVDDPAVPTERDRFERAASTADGPTGVAPDATTGTTDRAAGTTGATATGTDADEDSTGATHDADATTADADATTADADATTADADATTADADATAGAARPQRNEMAPPGPTTAGAAPGRDARPPPDPTADPGASTESDSPTPNHRPHDGLQRFGSGELLANVLVTHGLFAGLVAGAAVYWEVPASALGVGGPPLPALGWGVAAGLALYVANEVGAAAATRLGIDHEETLRELLAPDSSAEWVILLGGVLPVVAVGEELIFRGVLVGAMAAGFGLPIWGMAVASSVAFALGHGAQGTGGIVVTGLLGFALAAAFVVTGSLLLVIVAHYVVNALEFVVHEGVGVEWASST